MVLAKSPLKDEKPGWENIDFIILINISWCGLKKSDKNGKNLQRRVDLIFLK